MSDFDDLFKSRFEDHEVKVPDDMWDRIQKAQAPEDVKKPIFLFWKIGVAVLFLASIGILAFSLTSNIHTSDVTYNPSSTKINPTLEEDLSCLLMASLENQFNTNTESVVENTVKPTVVKEVVQKKTIQKSKTLNTNTSAPDIKAGNTVQTYITKKKDTKPSAYNKQGGSLGLIEKTKVQENFFSSRLDKIILNTSFPIQGKSLQTNFGLPEYDKKCPKFGNSVHGYFSIEGYHSSDINFRRFEAKTEESVDYMNSRIQTEHSQYSYSNGIKLKWHNSSGLGLGMGVERSVIRELFEFVDENSREVKVLISIDTLFESNGSFTTSTDTTRIELAGVTRNVYNNSYTSIDLPINLSYQFEFNKWALGLNAGLHVNLLFTQKGRILGFNRESAWISSGSQNELDIYQAKSGLKFDASVSIVYHLTSNLDIVAEPYFKYNRNTFTRDNSPLNQYYNTMGIRTGIRYNFGF